MKKTFSFKSSDNKHNINAILWEPDNEPVAVVQIIHGMLEFIDRYDRLAKYLNNKGIAVVGHDMLGHGNSVFSKAERGYIADDKNPEKYIIKDVEILRKHMRSLYPSLPYFMLGHSMGSFVLRSYLGIYADSVSGSVSGALIAGTGYESPIMAKLGVLITEAFRIVKGDGHRSKYVALLIKNKYYDKYDLTAGDIHNQWITRDIEIVKFYIADERCRFHFTINAYRALFNLVYYSCSKKYMKKIPASLPIYIFSGSEDPVGKMGRSPVKLKKELERLGNGNVSLKLYEGARHETHNELNYAEVYEDIYKWINNCL